MSDTVFVKQYIVKETLISTIINTAFSALISWFAFFGEALIYDQQLLFDAMPQSFFVTFFSVFVPTVLTRKRLARGALPTLSERRHWLPQRAFLRAIVLGVIVALLGGGLHYLVFLINVIEPISFGTVMIYKSLYGAVLASLLTPLALTLSLSESESMTQRARG